ncbi:hypothetical protein EJ05DRAFT_474211 [Pseudovirgaria hyperparasitica]|uniref:Uncharacterized protein n=1 Tax=Pseudovirgaria hyperparasitica TaxID=470096 RepID=A0A6A6WGP1_9PEZI|nr:uncharacterized protein EJ05DRAFT_474211 [Pseudovirgaria hyperparasitica]KAF2760321.1 hypothetical protein EJ05DRAFT_474211 [Pseudovirgaria hyperparasitica]
MSTLAPYWPILTFSNTASAIATVLAYRGRANWDPVGDDRASSPPSATLLTDTLRSYVQ